MEIKALFLIDVYNMFHLLALLLTYLLNIIIHFSLLKERCQFLIFINSSLRNELCIKPFILLTKLIFIAEILSFLSAC